MADLQPQTRDNVREGAKRSAAVLWPRILSQISLMSGPSIGWPHSILDVGAGEGIWLDAARELLPATKLTDVDLPSMRSAKRSAVFHAWDAEQLDAPLPTPDGEHYHLALCLEMAEHVSPPAGDHLVRELCNVTRSAIIWSAAIPGQGGDGHVNEQWPAYWAQRFAERGWLLTDPFRLCIWDDHRIEPWYRQNLLLAIPARDPDTGFGSVHAAALSLVHPVVYEHMLRTAQAMLAEYDALLRERQLRQAP